jgi:hypothetical protein
MNDDKDNYDVAVCKQAFEIFYGYYCSTVTYTFTRVKEVIAHLIQIVYLKDFPENRYLQHLFIYLLIVCVEGMLGLCSCFKMNRAILQIGPMCKIAINYEFILLMSLN